MALHQPVQCRNGSPAPAGSIRTGCRLAEVRPALGDQTQPTRNGGCRRRRKARPRCRRVHFRVEPKTITTFLIMAQIGYKTSSRKSSGTKASKPIVVQQIVVQAPQRRVYDIGDWRSALRSADNGRPKYLYDLFEDIMIDGVLADAINKRIEAVLNAEVVFMNARGQEEPAIAAMIDTTAWETLIREIMHRLGGGGGGGGGRGALFQQRIPRRTYQTQVYRPGQLSDSAERHRRSIGTVRPGSEPSGRRSSRGLRAAAQSCTLCYLETRWIWRLCSMDRAVRNASAYRKIQHVRPTEPGTA